MRARSTLPLLLALFAPVGCSNTPATHTGGTGGHFDAGTPVAGASPTGSQSGAAGSGAMPVAKVFLAPMSAKTTDALVADASATPSNTILRYDWSVDGQDIGWSQATLPPGKAKKRQRVRVTVTAIDTEGHQSAPASSEVVIVNSPPTVSSSPSQQPGAGGSVAFQVAASDPDGDTLVYKLPTPVAGATLSATGQLTLSTASIPAGGLTVPIEVSDPDGEKATTSVTVNRQ